jgi:hypothetical protein
MDIEDINMAKKSVSASVHNKKNLMSTTSSPCPLKKHFNKQGMQNINNNLDYECPLDLANKD